MFGDSKEKEVPPPAYTQQFSTTGPSTLSDTSHGATLSISSDSGSYLPGSTIDARLSIPKDILSSIQGEIRCSVEGKSSVEVMGKQRYQVCWNSQPSCISKSLKLRLMDRKLRC